MSRRRAVVLAVGAVALLLNTHSARGQGSQSSSPPGRIRIGGNVAAAQRLHTVPPMYPAIAKTAKIQGTVVLHAVIATDGTVKELQYVSGPPLLVKAAVDAVKQWTYKPYPLNGEAVEVDTTIQVVFALGFTMADDLLTENPTLARRLQMMLPEDVPVLDAAHGYKKVRDFEVALYAARDLSIPFVQFKCVELGGEYCNPPTKEKPKDAVKTIEALKPGMSKDDAKNAEKKAKEEAKALF